VKVNLRQVDVSQDLETPTSSEGELYAYIDTLKDAMADISSTLIDTMHGKLKKFGNTLKVTKKENKKAIKEVANAYNASKKKAEKAKANCKDGTYDEAAMLAAERAAADLKVYEFYVDYACKRYRKDVLGVYKH
jgi:predicted alternative tryptophan synthase beta-subunit